MSTNPEPTPLNQPYLGALSVLKQEFRAILGNFFYRFEHEKSSKEIMSNLLFLYETMLLSRSKEIGGSIYQHTIELMQYCSDYANGHGKLEKIQQCHERILEDLKRI